MNQLQTFHENIITSIVKLLAIPDIKKRLAKVETMCDEDPTLTSKIKELDFHYQDLQRQLKFFCISNPGSYLCKDYKGK